MINPIPITTVLLDLDDTILDENPGRMLVRRLIVETLHQAYPQHPPEELGGLYDRMNVGYWSDPGRHAVGRLDMAAARHAILTATLAELGLANEPLITRLTARYMQMRDEALIFYPGAVEVLAHLRKSYPKLGLLTNGAGPAQRAKIERFQLAGLFDHIQIEGDFGRGKPDPEVFRHALQVLGATPAEALMIGNDWRADIAPALALGMRAIHIQNTEIMAFAAKPEGEPSAHCWTVPGLFAVPELLRTSARAGEPNVMQ